jgi:creatinine amidohydrolase
MDKCLWRLEEVNQRDVLDMEPKYQVAVLPFGSTEPHNYHLPYGTDSLEGGKLADIICGRAWELGARVVLLPTVPYGINWNLMKFPMTIHVSSNTHRAIIREVAASLKMHNIRKLIIFNSHGGNEYKAIIRDLQAETDMFIASINWWICAPEKCKEIFEDRIGEHADEMETSVFMELFPDLVDLKQASKGKYFKSRFEAINNRDVWISRPWHLLTEDSGYGDPSKSTAEKGRQFIESITERLAGFLVELSKADMDERFPY